MADARTIGIALTVGPAGPGGIATYAQELAVALHRRTDVALTLIGSRAAIEEVDLAIGETHPPRPDRIELPANRMLESGRIVLLALSLRRRGIELVHGSRHVVPWFWRGPTVLTYHDNFLLNRNDDYDLTKRVLLPWVFRQSMKHAQAILTLSEANIAEAGAYVGQGVAVTSAGAAVPTRLQSAVPAPPNENVSDNFALVVGDANQRKRVEWLLDMWPMMYERFGSALVIAGGRAASAELLCQLRQATDRGDVFFVDSPSDGQLGWLYTSAQVVLDASEAEGFGFPAIEAEFFETPCVTARGGANDFTTFESQVAAALASPPSLHRPETSGSTIQGWDDVARRTVDTYRSVLAK